MPWLDILIFGIVIICCFIGFFKGFLVSLVGVCSSMVTLVLSLVLAKPVSGLFQNWFHIDKIWCIIIAVVALYVIIKILLWLFSKIFKGIIDRCNVLSKVDKILGVVFGLARGAFVIISSLGVLYLLGNVIGPVANWVADINAANPVLKVVYGWSTSLVEDVILPYIGGN